MSKHERELIVKDLKVLLANTYAVYLKTQNFHWNYVGGGEFFGVHLLLEKQYEEMAEAVDEIAERIRALQGIVEASFSSFKKLSSILDEEEVRPSSEMLKELAKCHELLVSHARSVLSTSEKMHDGATSDLLARRLGFHEKAIWMLKSSFSS